MTELNPDGNERLTAAVGIVLILLTVVELGTLVLGLGTFMPVHVFVGFVLLPPIALKLASTGWRFTRYYRRAAAYRLKGAPQIVMRLLAPVLVFATVVLFGSGVAMGFVHGSSLNLARQLHGPASAVWVILLGVHVLVYLQRALLSVKDDLEPRSRRSVRGAWGRTLLLVAAIVAGVGVGLALLPAQHRWLHLPVRQDGLAPLRSTLYTEPNGSA